jgi:preprotein translocase subunit SecG
VLIGLLLTIYILICFALMTVVLLQSGKGGGLSGAFGAAGGGAGQNLFGGSGATTVLTKATAVLGAGFLLMSLVLAMAVSRQSGPRSVVREASVPGSVAPPVTAPAPGNLGELPGLEEPAETPAEEAPAPGETAPEESGTGEGGGN